MKKNIVLLASALVIAGCTTAPEKTERKPDTAVSAQPDLSQVCLTDQGKPVSEGMTYKGKTCSRPDVINFTTKNNLVWR